MRRARHRPPRGRRPRRRLRRRARRRSSPRPRAPPRRGVAAHDHQHLPLGHRTGVRALPARPLPRAARPRRASLVRSRTHALHLARLLSELHRRRGAPHRWRHGSRRAHHVRARRVERGVDVHDRSRSRARAPARPRAAVGAAHRARALQR